MSFQQTIIVGNLGNNPEARFTPTGKNVTVFSVAVNNGEHTDWFKVEAWGKLGELCSQYLSKGRSVLVLGRIGTSPYINKEGKPAASLVLTAQTVKFLGAGPKGQDVEAHAEQVDAEDAPF
jgi:single-strand DNA-binding protein